MKIALWLTLGNGVFGLGFVLEWTHDDRGAEVQLGPLNLFWYRWAGTYRAFLGREFCKNGRWDWE